MVLPLVVRPEVVPPLVVRPEPEVVRVEDDFFLLDIRPEPEVERPEAEVVEPDVMVPDVEPEPDMLPEVMVPLVEPLVMLPEVVVPLVVPPDVMVPVVLPLVVVPLVLPPPVPPVVVPWSVVEAAEVASMPAVATKAAIRAVPRKTVTFFIAQKEWMVGKRKEIRKTDGLQPLTGRR
ncbi:hypothetical protein GCM10027175_36320 [Hymenobacter latericoloratus]